VSEHALVIGEALMDVVIRPDGSTTEIPGGSPANVAIGLARLGRQAELLAWIGLDDHGRLIREHLENSGVTLVRGSESAIHTPIATAVLDETGAADYHFDLTWAVSPNAAPTRKPHVVHTGSLGAILPPGGSDVLKLLTDYQSSATITYDPNVRPSLMGNPVTAGAQIDHVVAVADIVKVSDEDLNWLKSGEGVNGHVRRWLEMGPSIVVVTRGKQGATAFLKDARRIDVTAPQVDVVDTVGAGDSFMSGLIDGLWSQGCLGAAARDDLATISTDIIAYVLTRCVGIAAVTVSRAGANPPTLAELGEEPFS
jgi:fructokinase